MTFNKITIEATILADSAKVWTYYTSPEHITKWNFASDDWHCPQATNDLRVGGVYSSRMEAKDGSFGFDFNTVYKAIEMGKSFTYEMEDGRQANVEFTPNTEGTFVKVIFDAETQNSEDLQKGGWQAILNNFKKYVEASV